MKTAALGRFPESPVEPGSGPDRLRLVTWNLGYAGLGEESDFVADGGSSLRPPSRRVAQKNRDRILEQIGSLHADAYLFQEAAPAQPLNHWVDLLGGLRTTLVGCAHTYAADLRLPLLPARLGVTVGNASFFRFPVREAELHPLPLEPGRFFGLLRKRYRLHVHRLPSAWPDVEWVLVNVHLAAFDEAARVRHAQIRRLLDFAHREYAAGHFVVIGGDWNVELTGYVNPTPEKPPTWLHPAPDGLPPEGWHIAADSRVPSVRALDQPYRAGRTFTTVIDGFLVSPNVRIETVETIDLGFAASDHQPVTASIAAVP